MADLTTIPDPPDGHTEIFRVLLTATAATANLSPGRGGPVTQTGSPDFVDDGTADTILDGLNPWSPDGAQGDIRLRKSGDGFSAWTSTLPAGTTIDLRMATSAESAPDTVRSLTDLTRGNGYWNWRSPITPDGIGVGDTVALAMDVDVEYGPSIQISDASLSVEAGLPSATVVPKFTHTSKVSISVGAGEPTVTIAPETTIPSSSASVSVAADEPEVHIVIEFIAPSFAHFNGAAGEPAVTVLPVFIAPSFASFAAESREPTVFIDGFRTASIAVTAGEPSVNFIPEGVEKRNYAAEAKAHQVGSVRMLTMAGTVRTKTTA